MQGMSEREYSAHSKLSRGAIQKPKRNGRMVLFSDGSINVAASDARRAGMTDPDQQRRSLGSNESSISGPAESSSYLKARTALTVYPRQNFMHIDIGRARHWGDPFPPRANRFTPKPPHPARKPQ